MLEFILRGCYGSLILLSDRYSPAQLVLPILQISLKALYILSLCYHQGYSWSGKVQNSHQCILQRSYGMLPLCCSRKCPDTQWKVFWVKPSCYILVFCQHYPKRKIPVTFPGMLRYFLALHLCIELINLVSLIVQAPVVQRLDIHAIHRINHYPADSVVCFVNTYLLDSHLSGG